MLKISMLTLYSLPFSGVVWILVSSKYQINRVWGYAPTEKHG